MSRSIQVGRSRRSRRAARSAAGEAGAEEDRGRCGGGQRAAGVGASILPREAVRGAGPPGAVAIRPLDPPIPRRVVTLIRRDKPPSRALEIVRAALAETIAASQRAMALPKT